jgi:hypothetical protein
MSDMFETYKIGECVRFTRRSSYDLNGNMLIKKASLGIIVDILDTDTGIALYSVRFGDKAWWVDYWCIERINNEA